MTTSYELTALAAALAGLPGLAGLAPAGLVRLDAKGVSHDHWRLAGHDLVVRVARFHQWGLTPAAALAYEASAFERAAASRHTPRLHATVPVADGLPMGALVVDHVAGRPPRLPDDMGAIAAALAALHALAVPAECPPLLVHDDPFAATLAVIEEQAAFLPGAELAPQSREAIEAELDWARAEARRSGRARTPLALVGTDTHPGNFLVDGGGKAWFVDLEKALYGAAAIDLAHATLAASTGWDPDCAAALGRDEVRAFYRAYFDASEQASALGPTLDEFRRLTWLRTITWFGRWRADWAASKPDAERRAAPHIAAHVDASLAPAAVARQRWEWLGPDPLRLG